MIIFYLIPSNNFSEWKITVPIYVNRKLIAFKKLLSGDKINDKKKWHGFC